MARTYVAVVVSDSSKIKRIKTLLEREKLLNRNRKIRKTGSLTYVFSTLTEYAALESILGSEDEFDLVFYSSDDLANESSLTTITRSYLAERNVAEDRINQLLTYVPKKWSIYPPVVLLNPGTFDSSLWAEQFNMGIDKQDFCCTILSHCFPSGITHIAINMPIAETDVMRRPMHIIPFSGDFGPEPTFEEPTQQDFNDAFWCSVIQNGIYQTWAPRYTMFSRGNIKEKKRILDNFKCLQGQYVVDMYAGIGYFTLSYLANGATVFCWEINPWSIEGLSRGLKHNGYKYLVVKPEDVFNASIFSESVQLGIKAFLFQESNENALLRLSQLNIPISHINLGLLPSSEQSWATSRSISQVISTLKSLIIHIHENAHVDDFDSVKDRARRSFPGFHLEHIEKVKTYAPDVWHIVLDIAI
ncbi:uncharacterized protein PRCAT00005219001 [Priceomyces carsonii]|uniref:uncharacterized protein n=1 Tax=Priceomyces carsonii TaxID=28549 RepID=UPI002ED7EBC0|nr:unnamed protein product [Priceomyces carsonii]